MVDFSTQWGSVTDALSSGEFDPVGANNTYAYTNGFQAPTLTPQQPGLSWNNLQLPSLAGISADSFTGKSSGSVMGAGATGNVQPNGAPSYTIGQPSNAQAGAQPQQSSGIASGSIADYFLRGVIIVLGFIFVAIGLNMFRPGIVPNPVNVVRR